MGAHKSKGHFLDTLFLFSPDFLDDRDGGSSNFGGFPFFVLIPMHAVAFPRFLSELGEKNKDLNMGIHTHP